MPVETLKRWKTEKSRTTLLTMAQGLGVVTVSWNTLTVEELRELIAGAKECLAMLDHQPPCEAGAGGGVS